MDSRVAQHCNAMLLFLQFICCNQPPVQRSYWPESVIRNASYAETQEVYRLTEVYRLSILDIAHCMTLRNIFKLVFYQANLETDSGNIYRDVIISKQRQL